MAQRKADPNAWLVGLPLFVSGAGLTWSGHGRKPQWLQQELDSGTPLIEYLNPKHPDYQRRKQQLEARQ